MKYKHKLDKQQKKKKELDESEDYLKQIERSDSEGGRKFVVDKIKEEEKEKKDKSDTVKSVLESKKQRHVSYRYDLAKYGNWLLEEQETKGWHQEFVPTDGTRVKIYGKFWKSKPGIILVLKDPAGNVYVRGIKTTYVPEYDEAGIKTLVVQAENTIDSYKGLLL